MLLYVAENLFSVELPADLADGLPPAIWMRFTSDIDSVTKAQRHRLCRRVTYPMWCDIWAQAEKLFDQAGAADQQTILDRLSPMVDYARSQSWPHPPAINHPDAVAQSLDKQPNHGRATPIVPLARLADPDRVFGLDAGQGSGLVYDGTLGRWREASEAVEEST